MGGVLFCFRQWVWSFVVWVFHNCNSSLFGSGLFFFIRTIKDNLPRMLFDCGVNGGLMDGLGGFVGCWGFSRVCTHVCVCMCAYTCVRVCVCAHTRVFFIIIFNYYNILLLEFFYPW